jgi:hypothetical protein
MSQILALACRVDFVHIAALTGMGIATLISVNLYWAITMHFQGILMVYVDFPLCLLTKTMQGKTSKDKTTRGKA